MAAWVEPANFDRHLREVGEKVGSVELVPLESTTQREMRINLKEQSWRMILVLQC